MKSISFFTAGRKEEFCEPRMKIVKVLTNNTQKDVYFIQKEEKNTVLFGKKVLK